MIDSSHLTSRGWLIPTSQNFIAPMAAGAQQQQQASEDPSDRAAAAAGAGASTSGAAASALVSPEELASAAAAAVNLAGLVGVRYVNPRISDYFSTCVCSADSSCSRSLCNHAYSSVAGVVLTVLRFRFPGTCPR